MTNQHPITPPFDLVQAAGLRAVLAKWGKAPLLAIADELEAHG
jgi:hypothetical protein